ncbi:MAG TPA: PAS domain-containing sensor histidine kinase [Kofleriaceae bacterium]|jgi:PAS domain S-box-containing protein
MYDPALTGYLFEHARDIILVIDADSGAIIEANLAALHAYRYTREEILTKTVYDLRTNNAPVLDQMRVANRDGLLFETEHQRSDGTSFAVEVSSRGETMSGRRCLFSIVRDITDRKRFETEREDLLLATQRALSLRDDFLMIASHELRAPLTNVSLQLQNLQRLLDRGVTRAHLRVLADAAVSESARLTSLIDTLLDAQAARGHLALSLGDVDLGDLVRDVTARMRPRAEQSGSLLEIDVCSIRGRWDRLRLEQVLTNLLLNAFKFGRGKPVRVAAESEGAAACLEVSDQGIGVGADDLSRIFGKFERAVPSTYGGLGLGLFIARQIVEAHNGRVDVTSVPGIGSTFRVTLPCA